MTFPIFFLIRLFNAAGWPRKKGPFLRRKKVLPGDVIQRAYEELLKRGMTLGAFDTNRAIELLHDCYREKDWDHDLAEGFIEALEGVSGVRVAVDSELRSLSDVFDSMPGETMWGAILKMDPRTNQLFPQDEMVEVDVLEDDGVLGALHWNFAASLLFGIEHPTEVRTALELERSNMTRNLPRLIEAGLELPANYEPPSVDGYLSECLELTDSFADVRGALAPVPPKLVAEITRRLSQV